LTDYSSVTTELKSAYDARAEERDTRPVHAWKQEAWTKFLGRLQVEKAGSAPEGRQEGGGEGAISLLEIGAGTGQAGRFFQDAGLAVVCTDLSPEMVRLCRAKGLEAYVMDFLHLDFPSGRFDALLAQNCLLHVPKVEFGRVLKAIGRVVRAGGLLFIGGYGGQEFEGVREEDHYEPKRFYALYTHGRLRSILECHFDIVEFEVIPTDGGRFGDVQAITLRKRPQQA
jgi:SAM-dependent methyltransferase